jgi:hypothetical protein
MIKIFLLCPVPDNQKPINEYLSLQSSNLTNWIQNSSVFYSAKVRKIYSFIFFFFFSLKILNLNLWNYFSVSNFTLENFSIDRFNLQPILIIKSILILFLITNLTCLLFFFVILIQWKQLEKRLKDSRIFYEEGSWYDGQIWEKSFFILKNDRLLVIQLIEPFLKRFLITINRFSYFTIFQFFFLFLLDLY